MLVVHRGDDGVVTTEEQVEDSGCSVVLAGDELIVGQFLELYRYCSVVHIGIVDLLYWLLLDLASTVVRHTGSSSGTVFASRLL